MHQVHNRFAVYHLGQHPYRHALNEFAFTNSALPNVTNVDAALNWILAVLYPNTKPSVANPAALPLVGNDLNDYRVVQDDGDGKAASYRWEQREGEGAPSWHKIYDMDWGQDSILSAFVEQSQDLYVIRNGRTDLDGAGVPIGTIFAGQRIFGGNLTGQNLTLDANSVDSTGYVQTNNHFRPIQDNSFDLGTSLLKFRTLYVGTSAEISTLSFATGSITDSTGAISFGNENLTTTGNINGAVITASNSFVVGSLTISDGSIVDTDGTINFGSTALTTTGVITGGINSRLADITFANGSITSLSPAINFGSNNVITTGTLNAGNGTFTRLDSDNLRLDGNTLSVLDVNGNLNLIANGTGIISLQSAANTLGISATGDIVSTGIVQGSNLRFNLNTIEAHNPLFANITISPNVGGTISTTSNLHPINDNLLDFGLAASRIRKLFVGSAISDGTTEITQATLQSFRDANVAVAVGMTLFWTGTKWEPSVADSEVDHSLLSNLTTGDAGHTQFVMLAGRAGGQTIIGGTLAAQELILESTAHVTKGLVRVKDDFVPDATAAYSGGWTGVDLGSASLAFNDIYSKGEHKGLRLENFTTAGLPASSAQNVGRVMWNTDENKIYVDKGTTLVAVGTSKYLNDEVFDGIQLTKTVTVSGSIVDARRAIWQLQDNAADFEQIYCSIKAISATQVTITTSAALPAASYRLIGIE